MASLGDIHDRHGAYMDSQLASFEHNLDRIVRRAQDNTLDYLLQTLNIEDGKIATTLANRRILQRVAKLFMEEMDREGYSALVSAFVNQFPNQRPFMDETLELIAEQADVKLPPLTFSKADTATLTQLRSLSVDSLESEVAAEAGRVAGRLMFGVGGLPFSQLVTIIRTGFDMTVPRAGALADTLQAGFYRTMLDRQYLRIESGQKTELAYRYSGPQDRRNRPFCSHLMSETKSGKSWTKDQINEMDNGVAQPKPTWIFCGGFMCRHQWIPDFKVSE